ncbi:hypothetical protein RZS08_27545, partial [Arthrospira platensis SPKY1]|nr:hypothetical protein [Arthrospira platensis SPKY1]
GRRRDRPGGRGGALHHHLHRLHRRRIGPELGQPVGHQRIRRPQLRGVELQEKLHPLPPGRIEAGPGDHPLGFGHRRLHRVASVIEAGHLRQPVFRHRVALHRQPAPQLT